MAKKRKRKISVSGCIEGDREERFLSVLIYIYKPRDNFINPAFDNSSGGTPDKIVGDALKKIDRDKSFVWFDEDFEPEYPLGKDTRELLIKCWCIPAEQTNDFLVCPLKDLQNTYNPNNKKKPTFIISQPVCVESLILKALGEQIPYPVYIHVNRKAQIDGLKQRLNQLFTNANMNETEFYKNNLTKALLDQRKLQCPELELLISMIT